MRKYVYIALAILVVGGVGFYVYLGGLNSVEITIESVDGYKIAGRDFLGEADDENIEKYFFEAKELTQSGALKGSLAILHYNDTTLEKKQIHLFVGVVLDSDFSGNLPAEYELKNVACNQAIRATIEAHNAVIPGPDTIEERLKEKGAEANLQLTSYTIEKYISENLLVVDWPVKD